MAISDQALKLRREDFVVGTIVRKRCRDGRIVREAPDIEIGEPPPPEPDSQVTAHVCRGGGTPAVSDYEHAGTSAKGAVEHLEDRGNLIFLDLVENSNQIANVGGSREGG